MSKKPVVDFNEKTCWFLILIDGLWVSAYGHMSADQKKAHFTTIDGLSATHDYTNGANNYPTIMGVQYMGYGLGLEYTRSVAEQWNIHGLQQRKEFRQRTNPLIIQQ